MKADIPKIKKIAFDLADTLGDLPLDGDKLSAVAIFVATIFEVGFDPHHRLIAFDQFTKLVRHTIKESLT